MLKSAHFQSQLGNDHLLDVGAEKPSRAPAEVASGTALVLAAQALSLSLRFSEIILG